MATRRKIRDAQDARRCLAAAEASGVSCAANVRGRGCLSACLAPSWIDSHAAPCGTPAKRWQHGAAAPGRESDGHFGVWCAAAFFSTLTLLGDKHAWAFASTFVRLS